MWSRRATVCAIAIVAIVVIVVLLIILKLLSNAQPIIQDTTEADIVIVGAGTAGCILARRLSERHPCLRVIVLERGISYRDDPVVYNPKNMVTAGYSPPYSELLPTDFGPTTVASVARMYGGGSSHNFLLAVRGSPSYYQTWQEKLGLSYTDLLPYFGRVEAYHPEFSNTVSGTPNDSQVSNLRFKTGSIQITPLPVKLAIAPRIIPGIGRAITDGAGILLKALNVISDHGPLRASDSLSTAINNAISSTRGVDIVKDYNAGVGTCTSSDTQLFVDSVVGIRQSTDVKYLSSHYLRIDPQSRGKSIQNKLQVVPNATVSRIQQDRVEWVDTNGKTHTTRVGKKVIVCGGGIYSPYILLKSGFTTPGLGQGLKTHCGFTMVVAVDISPSNDPSNCAVETFSFSGGPVAFVPRNNNQSHANNQRDWQVVVSGSAPQALIDAVGGIPNSTANTKTFGIILWNIRPRSSGFIDANGAAPGVNLKLYSDGDVDDPASDISSVVDGMRWLGNSFLPALQATYPSLRTVYPPIDALKRDVSSELADLAKKGMSLTDHYSCTCAVGSVVDPQTFLLRGTDNIHVVDASVLPAINDGNTCYPAMVMAEVAADRISGLL